MAGGRLLLLAAALIATAGATCLTAAPVFLEEAAEGKDPCSFCRALLSADKDVCDGKSDPEECAAKAKKLKAGCRLVITDPCCKPKPSTFSERAVSCANVMCAMMVPACPSGKSLADKPFWKGCCFSAEDDCTSDMCKVGHGMCANDAMCQADSLGKASCKCNLGYSGDGTVCAELNNCQNNYGNCDPQASCKKLGPGKHQCTCNPGFTGSGTLSSPCSAVNKCADESLCDAQATCHSRGPGLAVCTCNPHYTGAGTPGNCTVEDLCNIGNGGCHNSADCKMAQPGVVACQCAMGFTGSGKHCQMMHPCEDASTVCDANAKCTGSAPGASRCECNTGFQGDGNSCTARDNCKQDEMNNCHKFGGMCIMTGPSTHKCECLPGFSGDGVDCVPFYPCNYSFGGCDASPGVDATEYWSNLTKTEGATPGPYAVHPDGTVGLDMSNETVSFCTNLPRGKNKCTCRDGYEKDPHARMFKCRMTNKCQTKNVNGQWKPTEDNGGCHKFAKCIHLGHGRNLCQCMQGFHGDGRSNCSEINPCTDAAIDGGHGCDEKAGRCVYEGPPRDPEGKYMASLVYGKAYPEGHFNVKRDPRMRPSGDALTATPYGSYGVVHTCECVGENYTGNGTHCERKCDIHYPDAPGGHCANWGVLHPAFNYGKCQCTLCKFPWEGKLCDECPRSQADCKNGGSFDLQNCSCFGCDAGWSGDLCQHCNRTWKDCEHGGKLNRNTCECERCGKYISPTGPHRVRSFPIQRWTGELCEKCDWDITKCVHPGVPSTVSETVGDYTTAITTHTPGIARGFNTSTCTCEQCMYPWGGALCEVCKLKSVHCRHGSSLSYSSCKCERCPHPWGGELCNTCEYFEKCNTANKEGCPCKHGSVMDKKTCKCVDPVGPWHGWNAAACNRMQDDCYSGVLISATCTCTDCRPNWSGDLCEVCGLTQASCKHGGEFDPERCVCRNCRAPWGGETCETCERSRSDCEHGSEPNMQTCNCAKSAMDTVCPNSVFDGKEGPPWEGATCGACPLRQDDCKHGGVLDTENCICSQCAPWNGDAKCNTCVLTDVMCGAKSGAKADMTSCKCVVEGRVASDTDPCNTGSVQRWGGDTCSNCLISFSACKHFSKLDFGLCQCVERKEGTSTKCPFPWKGLTCDECVGNNPSVDTGIFVPVADASQAGANFNSVTCKYEGCNAGWGGRSCDNCILAADSCLHGSKVKPDTCQCEDANKMGRAGESGWTGIDMGTCGLSTNGNCGGSAHGIVNEVLCFCNCKVGWEGDDCETQAS